MKVLIGCEQFGKVRSAFRRRGHDAWSCDVRPTRDGSEYHLHCDVLSILDDGWDLAIFHPDCTYLTCSAEWAYGDGPYHQKVKPDTLVGAVRREARKEAVEFVKALANCAIPKIAIENPRGKATCLWLKGLPALVPTKMIEPRMIGGKPRWANQTDTGQNKLPPSSDRAMQRAATYAGIADAFADQWGGANSLQASMPFITRAVMTADLFSEAAE